MLKKEKNSNNLYREFKKIYSKGSPTKLKNFIRDNSGKFSQRVKNKIILFLFIKNLVTASKKNAHIIKLKKEGIDSIEKLKGSKKALSDELNILNIREKLK